MSKRDFSQALRRAYDELIPHTVPREIDAKIRAGIAARARARRHGQRRLRLVAGLTLAAAAAALAWVAAPVVLSRLRPERAAAFVVRDKTADARIEIGVDGDVYLARGDCSLVDPALRVELRAQSGSRVRKDAAGIRVVTGRVSFKIASRVASEAAVQVLVSGGVIQVVGTAFDVTEAGTSGDVHVQEGTVRFVDLQGRATLLAAGGLWTWRRPRGDFEPATPHARPAPAPALDRKVPRKAPRSANASMPAPIDKQAESILARVTSLRSRNQYEQAVIELTYALEARQRYPSATRERLSFERGSILTYVLNDSARACPQWIEHQREFSPGRYAIEVTRAITHLGCIQEVR